MRRGDSGLSLIRAPAGSDRPVTAEAYRYRHVWAGNVRELGRAGCGAEYSWGSKPRKYRFAAAVRTPHGPSRPSRKSDGTVETTGRETKFLDARTGPGEPSAIFDRRRSNHPLLPPPTFVLPTRHDPARHNPECPLRVLAMASSMSGGGSERQTALLLRHLDRRAFEPHLYLIRREGELLADIPGDVRIHADDDEVHAVRFRDRFPGGAHGARVERLTDLIREQSIDVVYDRTFHMTQLAGPAAAAVGVPRVATIVSPPHVNVPHLERRYRWIKRRMLRTAYRRAAGVVAVSDAAADSAAAYYGIDRPRVVPNPVDAERIRRLAGVDDASVGPEAIDRRRSEPFVFVIVGRLSPEKGTLDLLNALANHPPDVPCHFRFIGDGCDRDAAEAIAADISNARPQLSFTFDGSSDNPYPAIRRADALILPSRFEGLPNAAMEAMTLGTPVVATRVGGTPTLERDAPTIFWAEPEDPGSLATAIRQVISGPDIAQDRAANAVRLIAEHHDLERTIRKIEGILLEAAGR